MGNTQSRANFNSLLECSLRGKTTAVRRLINSGVKLNNKDPETGDTAVHRATMRNQTEVLSLLLRSGAKGDTLNIHFETALSIAVENLLPDCVEILVKNKCDVNVITRGGITAFHRALVKYDYHLKYGSDSRLLDHILLTLINAPKLYLNNDEGYRCLEIAIRCELVFMVRRIIERFPELLQYTIFDETIMKQLINFGNISRRISSLLLKEAMLYWAIRRCHPFAVEFLVSIGANCNMLSSNYGTLVHLAFSLLDSHPSLKVAFPHSKTQIASIYNSLEERSECCKRRLAVALYLVEFGNANIAVRDGDGKTPFDVIEINDEEEKTIVQDLLQRCVERVTNKFTEDNFESQTSVAAVDCIDVSDRNFSQNENLLCCNTSAKTKELEEKVEELSRKLHCQICFEREKVVVFLCGHGTCGECVQHLVSCHICRKTIEGMVRLY